MIYLSLLLILSSILSKARGFSPALTTNKRSNLRLISALQASENAMFGMGCFWNPQEVFLSTPGVTKVSVGYANKTSVDSSSSETPSYMSVCTTSDYTEAILIEYDSTTISFPELLGEFWKNHDASDRAKTQYQSVIWPLSPEQREMALTDVDRASEAYKKDGRGRVLTTVANVTSTRCSFTPAESIHDRYWPKTTAKVGIYVTATYVGLSQHNPDLDLLIKPVLGLVAAWLIWEVVELGISAVKSLKYSR